MNSKIIFIPGNGGEKTSDNFFAYLHTELERLGLEVIAETFPDPLLARRSYWIPFLEKIGTDENTILIGHSSGAVAAMRYAETHNILGSVLIGACYTDLGLWNEKIAGYYDEPWNWEAIKKNQTFIGLFASTNDQFIPIEEAHYIRDNLQPEYFEFTDRGHFMISDREENKKFPEVVEFIKSKLA